VAVKISSAFYMKTDNSHLADAITGGIELTAIFRGPAIEGMQAPDESLENSQRSIKTELQRRLFHPDKAAIF
jgi:hypothetical protein